MLLKIIKISQIFELKYLYTFVLVRRAKVSLQVVSKFDYNDT